MFGNTMSTQILRSALSTFSFVLSAAFCLPTYSQGFFDIEDDGFAAVPKLTVSLPSKRRTSEFYYVQPVNVGLENVDGSDGLASLTLTVTSNPVEHQQVMTATFADDSRIHRLSTRIRLAGTNSAIVEAVAKAHSGKSFTASDDIGLSEGVDFSDARGLTQRLKMNVRGLAGPIGTSRSRVAKKSMHSRQLSAVVHHPMLPRSAAEGPNLLSRIEIIYRGEMLGRFDLGDAISNDPYIDIRFSDKSSGVGPHIVRWIAADGGIFESHGN